MRFLRVITSGIAVIFSLVAGVVATAVIALAGLAIVIIARLLGRRQPEQPAGGRRNAMGRPAAGDVIDISATEISAEPPAR